MQALAEKAAETVAAGKREVEMKPAACRAGEPGFALWPAAAVSHAGEPRAVACSAA
jgi:hypothetical protein